MLKAINNALLFVFAALLFSCGADHYIKRGDRAFALGKYHSAATEYKTAYNKTSPKDRPSRGQRALKLARCYDRIGYCQQSVAAYRNAIRYGQDSARVHLDLANVLMRTANYKAAADEYAVVLDKEPDCQAATRGLSEAKTATTAKKQAAVYKVKRMDVFNSRRSDYSPFLCGDNAEHLYFTTTRPTVTGQKLSGVTGDKQGDIFVSSKNERGQWLAPVSAGIELNTDNDEGACCFSPDGRTMFLTQCVNNGSTDAHARIVTSTRQDAEWGETKPFIIANDTVHNFAHPAVSPDGAWLYFSSDMRGGQGGYDLWRARLVDGKPKYPENLGNSINTADNEVFPTFRPNGDLCFSSNGRGGLGGLDVFIAHRDESTGLYTVEHPSYPINSEGDDFGLTYLPGGNAGYMSSNRGDARGRDHIYSFESTVQPLSVRGYVYEKDGYELPQARIYMVGDDGTNTNPRVKGDGSFTEVLHPGTRYVILATCKGFLNHKEELEVQANDSTSGVITLQFPLASIRVPVLIDNIFYDFNRASLRPESAAALDKLVTMLTENPNTSIEIAAHCDYKGSATYNQQLSERRAENVVKYLKEHGINGQRLTYRGYGKQLPRTVNRRTAEQYPWLKEGTVLTEGFINALPDDHKQVCNQLNRRTEFTVTGSTFGIIDNNKAPNRQ